MHAAHDVNRRAVGRTLQQRHLQRLPVGGGQGIGAARGGVFLHKAVKIRRGQGLQRRRVRQFGQRRGGRGRGRDFRRWRRAGRGGRLRLRRTAPRQQQRHRGTQQAPQQRFFHRCTSFLSARQIFARKRHCICHAASGFLRRNPHHSRAAAPARPASAAQRGYTVTRYRADWPGVSYRSGS